MEEEGGLNCCCQRLTNNTDSMIIRTFLSNNNPSLTNFPKINWLKVRFGLIILLSILIMICGGSILIILGIFTNMIDPSTQKNCR